MPCLSCFFSFRMIPNRQLQRTKEFWRGRNASARLGLEVIPLNETALQKRIELNSTQLYIPPEHPFCWDIPEWKLTDEHLKTIEILKDKSLQYIDNYNSFLLIRDHLTQQKEFSLDLEFCDDYSFLNITCLIQISTKSHDFIIDAIKLYNYIPEMLKDILLDPKILKVFFSQQDVLAFQRDFDLRIFPLVDFQNIYQKFNGLHELPGFKTVVENILEAHGSSVEIDKVYQSFNWRLRPLPDGAIKYARQDSQLLLECWEKFKITNKSFLESLNYDFHHKLMLKSYKFPVVQDYNFYFNHAWEQASDQLKEQFNPNDIQMFRNLHHWRFNTAMLTDKKCHNIFSDLDTLKLSVMKPNTIKDVDECSYKLKCLDENAKLSILSIICRYSGSSVGTNNTQCTVTSQHASNELEKSKEQESITDMETEIIYVKKCITCERGLDCNNCKQKGNNNPFNVIAYDNEGKRFTMHDYLNYKVKDKTLKNYFAKKKKLLDRICINDHRLIHGLKPIKFCNSSGNIAKKCKRLQRK